MQNKTIYAKLIHTGHHSNRYCYIRLMKSLLLFTILPHSSKGVAILLPTFLSALVAQVSIPLRIMVWEGIK